MATSTTSTTTTTQETSQEGEHTVTTNTVATHTTTVTTMEGDVTNMESQDNPFLPDGDLSKEVEMMLKRSTISRTQILIPDKENQKTEPQAVTEPVLQANTAGTVSAEKPQTQPNDVANASTNEIKPKENGKVEETTSPQQVDVKVTPEEGNKDNVPESKGDTPAADSEKPKKVRGKCCTVM